MSRILSQWWGANSSESAQKALDAAMDCGAELFLPADTYAFDTTVEYLFSGPAFDIPGLSVSGSGPGKTIIDNQTTGNPAFHFGTVNSLTETGLFLSIGDLEITSSTATGSHGIQIEDIWFGRISSCYIQDLSGGKILKRFIRHSPFYPTWSEGEVGTNSSSSAHQCNKERCPKLLIPKGVRTTHLPWHDWSVSPEEVLCF